MRVFLPQHILPTANANVRKHAGFTVNSLVLHFCHTHQNLVIKHIKAHYIWTFCASQYICFCIHIKSSHTHVRFSLGILDSFIMIAGGSFKRTQYTHMSLNSRTLLAQYYHLSGPSL